MNQTSAPTSFQSGDSGSIFPADPIELPPIPESLERSLLGTLSFIVFRVYINIGILLNISVKTDFVKYQGSRTHYKNEIKFAESFQTKRYSWKFPIKVFLLPKKP